MAAPIVRQDGGDLATKEDEGRDRDDGDQGEDQGVLSEALAILIVALQKEIDHVSGPP